MGIRPDVQANWQSGRHSLSGPLSNPTHQQILPIHSSNWRIKYLESHPAYHVFTDTSLVQVTHSHCKSLCLRLWWSLHVSTPRRRPPPGGSAFEALCGQSLPPATQASAGSSDTSHSPRISGLFCACRLECFSCIHLCLWTSSSYCLLTRQSRPDIKLSPFFFFFLSILFKYNIYRRA